MLCLTLCFFCTINNILPFENGVFKRQPSLWDLQSFITYGLQQVRKIMGIKNTLDFENGVFKRHQVCGIYSLLLRIVCNKYIKCNGYKQ